PIGLNRGAMSDDKPAAHAGPEEVRAQLDKTVEDLRTLAVQIGAVEPGAPREMTVRRARITFAVVVVLAVLACWVVWQAWHSLLAAAAPLIWIFGHGWRWRRRVARSDANDGT